MRCRLDPTPCFGRSPLRLGQSGFGRPGDVASYEQRFGVQGVSAIRPVNAAHLRCPAFTLLHFRHKHRAPLRRVQGKPLDFRRPITEPMLICCLPTGRERRASPASTTAAPTSCQSMLSTRKTTSTPSHARSKNRVDAPHVCVLVEEHGRDRRWESVVADGLYEKLDDLPDHEGLRDHVWPLLSRYANWREPAVSSRSRRSLFSKPRRGGWTTQQDHRVRSRHQPTHHRGPPCQCDVENAGKELT